MGVISCPPWTWHGNLKRRKDTTNVVDLSLRWDLCSNGRISFEIDFEYCFYITYMYNLKMCLLIHIVFIFFQWVTGFEFTNIHLSQQIWDINFSFMKQILYCIKPHLRIFLFKDGNWIEPGSPTESGKEPFGFGSY